MIHPGVVAITPSNLNRVSADRLNLGGFDTWVNGGSLNGPLSRVLVNTAGTGAIVSNFDVGDGEPLTGIPSDRDLGRAKRFNLGRDKAHLHSIDFSCSRYSQ